MGALLEGLPVGNIGAGALVCLIVLLILTGRLVPRQQMLDLREDRDKWRASAEDQLKALHTLGMAVEKLTIVTQATNHALVEIQELPQRVAEERP
ncbi:hypothetical protein [Blastococcus sp. SYSU D00813]